MAEESFEVADPLDPNDVQGANALAKATYEQDVAAQQAFVRRRREAYSRLFAGRPMAGDADTVMADLRRFCRGGQTPWDSDARVHALLTGRSEVFARIRQHIDMPFDEHWELVSGGNE